MRDLLLGLPPRDFDIATSATPDQLRLIYPHADFVGAHFGVALIAEGSATVEVATYRHDHEYHDGRRPSEVTFETDPRKDVVRRDFTINGLLLDPENGAILDFVGGREDLGLEMVRAIGNPERRFREDHLRLIRAIRLAAKLRFDVESETEAAIVRLHPLIQIVSPERVRDELVRILTEGGARRGFELLDRTGLLQEILPEVAALKGVRQPPDLHPEGDVWTHTLLMLGRLENPSTELALAVLLHDTGKPSTFSETDRIRFDGHVDKGVRLAHRILTRLRFSNEQIHQVESLIDNHARFLETPHMKMSRLKRFMRLPRFDEHLELHRLDCVASHGRLDVYEYVIAKRAEFGDEQIHPERLLTGDDLLALGVPAGPELGRVLHAVEDAQLDGEIRTRDQAIELARQLLT